LPKRGIRERGFVKEGEIREGLCQRWEISKAEGRILESLNQG